MSDYVIFTDSCADLSPDMYKELEVELVPMHFTLNDRQYTCWPDGREIAFPDFYNDLRGGGMSTTAQVPGQDFIDLFRPVLESGRDILYLGFSSGLSGTIQSAIIAATDLMEEFPDRKVKVVDSLCASLGQGLFVWHVARQKKQGLDIEQAAKWAEENKMKLVHWFTVDDLQFLKRGGRLSGTAALLGTMLGIKPVLHVDDEGHLIAIDKVRGRKKSLERLVERMAAAVTDPANQTVFISHGDALEDARFVADEVKRRFGTKDIYINYIGPVIGGHSGPGTIALFFLGESREIK